MEVKNAEEETEIAKCIETEDSQKASEFLWAALLKH